MTAPTLDLEGIATDWMHEQYLAYVGSTAYRRQIADGIGRCHISRGEVEAARRLAPDARPTWFTHSLTPLLDLWDGR